MLRKQGARGFQAAALFQWAPTLGGECYLLVSYLQEPNETLFQWAPTLGGECYPLRCERFAYNRVTRFNGHPPLGVNATGVRA